MRWRVGLGLIGALLVVVAAILIVGLRDPETNASELATTAASEVSLQPMPETVLYFPGPRGYLVREARTLDTTAGIVESTLERATRVVEELLSGPRNEGLLPALPPGTRLRAAYHGREGELFIDFEPANAEARPEVGSFEELLMVYAVIDSVTANLPEVKKVGLLWSGRQTATFSGHVDATRPLAARHQGIVDATAGDGE